MEETNLKKDGGIDARNTGHNPHTDTCYLREFLILKSEEQIHGLRLTPYVCSLVYFLARVPSAL
jgi:hypothetical protein